MKCKFVVGQKVVCIAELTYKCTPRHVLGVMPSLVSVGTVYTVAEIDADIFFKGDVVIRLKELPGDEWFEHTAFKPLEERKTDISVFTRMLNTKHRELTK